MFKSNPQVFMLFNNDEEDLYNFLDSLSIDEMSIIAKDHRPETIIKIKMSIEDDLNDTAKQLAME